MSPSFLRRMARVLVPVGLLALLWWLEGPGSAPSPPREDTASRRTTQADETDAPSTAGRAYDYYLMALSWSPTWCEAHPDDAEQCAHKGYGFVLHGLWPQYEAGGGPQSCPSGAAPDRRTVEHALGFMPSRALIRHEWNAHGSCSGMTPPAYFALADRAFAAVRVPPELNAPTRMPQLDRAGVTDAFRRANPGLSTDMLAIQCSGRDLSEVRVCLDLDLSPRRCGARVRSRCPDGVPLRIPLAR